VALHKKSTAKGGSARDGTGIGCPTILNGSLGGAVGRELTDVDDINGAHPLTEALAVDDFKTAMASTRNGRLSYVGLRRMRERDAV
jgi:hypothetical protein